jgi:bifunctional protein TilS/HprT
MKLSMKPLKLNLDVNKTYLVAVSYGPDSMALLSLLIECGYRVEVAHVNHKKRIESDQEAVDLKTYCDEHHIRFHSTDFHSMQKGNFQAAARKCRYAFFASLIHARKLDALLTAHHYDDHLETAYFQKVRLVQTPYMGMRQNTVLEGIKVIRPLIEVRKQTLLDYCADHKVPFAIDGSNESMIYSRNRIRKLLQKMNRKDFQTFEREVVKLNLNLRKDEEVVLPYLSLQILPISSYQSFTNSQTFLYWTFVFNLRGLNVPVGKTFLHRIAQMIKSSKPNMTFKLSKDYTLFKTYLNFRVVHQNDVKPYSYVISKPTDVDSSLIQMKFPASFHLSYPFVVRSVQPKDKHKVDGHVKTVRRLFIDWKVPSYLRLIWPIFTDRDGQIIHIPRYREKIEIKANNWLILKE